MLCSRARTAVVARSVDGALRLGLATRGLSAALTRLSHNLGAPCIGSWSSVRTHNGPWCGQARQYAISTHAAKTKVPQCPTCGAAFQTEHQGAPGYLNQQKWKQMNQSNIVAGLPIIEANKADLLPKDYHEERLKMWFKRFTKDLDLNIQSIHLVSALKNLGTRELAADISERRRAGQDIYMVGRANVGKSELINALLRISIGGSKHRVLASHIPGTTMGLAAVPLRHFVKALVPAEGPRPQDRQASLYDTPGVFSSKSITSHLTSEELKSAICSKRIVPFSFILNRNQAIMLGGLGRLELIDGPDRVYVTVFTSVRPHFTNVERAAELMKRLERGERTILQPPFGDAERLKSFPQHRVALEHTFEGLHRQHATLDVAFAGIGWIAITGQFPTATIRAFAPNGHGVCVRPPMMPFEYKKISPHMSAARKTPK
ncbi:nitric oxide associated protein 1 [Coemansia sp. RSA 376]|nr:nitric oxide associated protein 1 [Coemansia sp. RSA 376]